MTRGPQDPVYFGALKGHLVPEIERIHQKAIELERAHIATLNDGESFCVKFVMVKGALRIILEPKRIEIA